MNADRHVFSLIWQSFVWLVVLLGGFLLLSIGFQRIFPAGLQTPAVNRAKAYLFPNYPENPLPTEVKFTIDGSSAVFHRDTEAYAELMALLHHGRSDKLIEQAGGTPGDRGPQCGEMIVSCYGMTSHFRIMRSPGKGLCYWIALPKTTSIGTSYPLFTVDPRVVDFIRTHRTTER